MTPYTCITSGSHPVVTGYTLYGAWVEVLGRTAVVYLTPVNNGAGGTVDVKIQECDTQGTTLITDLTTAFTQVTESNDTVIQELAYTGSKKYIRTAAKTLVNACEFGTSVMVWEPNVSEDSTLLELITNGTNQVENDTNKKIIQQVWDYFPAHWPCGDRIKIPFGNLRNDTGNEPVVKWKAIDGTETTLTVTTDYIVETCGTQCGSIVLPPYGSWPSGELYPSKPISIRFTCGYATAAEVPVAFKQAIKRHCADNYTDKGDKTTGQTVVKSDTYNRQVNLCGRLHDMDFI
jgi:uncharacterized phiE125 gp8 family phage protein